MHLFHFYQHHHLAELSKSKFWKFEFSLWLHIFARSMIAVFVPIIMLQAGYELSTVMLYYMLFHLVDVPLNFFAAKLIQKIGGKMTLIISTGIVIAYFLLLDTLTAPALYSLMILAVLAALYDSLYWVSHLYLFLESEEKESTKASEGTDTSILYIVKRLAGLLGPAIGGLLLIFFSQNILIVTSVIFFILSIFPLVSAHGMHDKPARGILPIKSFLAHPRERRNHFSTAVFGIHRNIEMVIWPIFIYITLENIQSVAYVPIIVSITSMIFAYFIGKRIAKGVTSMIIIGGVLTALAWGLRMLIPNPTFYFISIFFVGLFTLTAALPLDSDMFRRGRMIDSLSAATYRNVFSMTPRIFLYGGLAIISAVFDVSFITAIASLLTLVIINLIFLNHKKVHHG